MSGHTQNEWPKSDHSMPGNFRVGVKLDIEIWNVIINSIKDEQQGGVLIALKARPKYNNQNCTFALPYCCLS